jgi:hypothetical protein
VRKKRGIPFIALWSHGGERNARMALRDPTTPPELRAELERYLADPYAAAAQDQAQLLAEADGHAARLAVERSLAKREAAKLRNAEGRRRAKGTDQRAKNYEIVKREARRLYGLKRSEDKYALKTASAIVDAILTDLDRFARERKLPTLKKRAVLDSLKR